MSDNRKPSWPFFKKSQTTKEAGLQDQWAKADEDRTASRYQLDELEGEKRHHGASNPFESLVQRVHNDSLSQRQAAMKRRLEHNRGKVLEHFAEGPEVQQFKAQLQDDLLKEKTALRRDALQRDPSTVKQDNTPEAIRFFDYRKTWESRDKLLPKKKIERDMD